MCRRHNVMLSLLSSIAIYARISPSPRSRAPGNGLTRADVGSSIPFIRSGVHVQAHLNKEQAMPNHPVSYYVERRQALMDQYMPGGKAAMGPDHPSTGGVHHLALVCSDLQRTIEFYTNVLKMPLVKIVPNRDEP